MLEAIFGNSTIEKVLLFLYTYREGYGKQISDNFNISLNGIQQQMQRLEEGGVVVSQKKGNTRLYVFNPRYVFLKELEGLLSKAMDLVSEKELQKYYRKRTRPRKKGKPL